MNTVKVKQELGETFVTVLTGTGALAILNHVDKKLEEKAIAAGKERGFELEGLCAVGVGAGVYATSTQENPYVKAAGRGISTACGLKLLYNVVNKGAGTAAKNADGTPATNTDGSAKVKEQKLKFGLGEIPTAEAWGMAGAASDTYDEGDMQGYNEPTGMGRAEEEQEEKGFVSSRS